MYVPTVCACVRVCAPTTHPAGSFRVGSDERRTITRKNRENRKEESSLNGGRENERGEREQDRESKRHKEIERLGKISSKSDERNSGREQQNKKRDMVRLSVEISSMKEDTGSKHYLHIQCQTIYVYFSTFLTFYFAIV